MRELVSTEWLRIKLTNHNDGRTRSFHASHTERKDLGVWIRAKHGKRTPFAFPVRLEVTRILGPREQLWDFSSCGRGNWKEIEDALVANGWFIDDGPKYITGVEFLQDSTKRDSGPSIKIDVFKTAESFVHGKQRVARAK